MANILMATNCQQSTNTIKVSRHWLSFVNISTTQASEDKQSKGVNMATLTESSVNSQFIGCSICADKLWKCAKKNRETAKGSEFIVYSCRFLYDNTLCKIFGVTDKLKDLWERRGTEFNIYLYVSDGALVSANIFKYTESGGARPSISTPKCTQQELRVAKRILEYITK